MQERQNIYLFYYELKKSRAVYYPNKTSLQVDEILAQASVKPLIDHTISIILLNAQWPYDSESLTKNGH